MIYGQLIEEAFHLIDENLPLPAARKHRILKAVSDYDWCYKYGEL